MSVRGYLVAEGRLRDELHNLDVLLSRLADLSLYPVISARAVGGFPLTNENAARVVGSYLQDFYNCFESMAKAVVRSVDGVGLPEGSDWHSELLRQMSTPVRGVRPALITSETAKILDEFRGFRHVFRNVYGFGLDPHRTLQLLSRLPAAVSRLKRDVMGFMDQMSRSLEIPCPDQSPGPSAGTEV